MVQKTKIPVTTSTVHLRKIRMLIKRRRKNKKHYQLLQTDITSPIKEVSKVEITTLKHKRPITIQETKAATA